MGVNMKIVRKHQYATFFVSLIACPASVWAQDGAAAQDGSVPEETGGSSEIIVTGTKRSSSLQDTPVAVTALSSDDITTRGLSSTEDLIGQIPSLQLSAQTGAALVSIRGVGLGVETAAAEPGVAIHVDGVYQPRATTSQLATLDLERIEVLRGPQGTLYGRNATGGVINFISKAPTSYFEAEASLKVGNYDLIGGQAMVSGPLAGDDLLGRFVAYRQSRSGYVDNILLDRKDGDLDEWGGRLSLQWRAGDDTTVDLVARYAEVESSPVTVMITPPSQDDIDFMLATSPPGTQFITTNEPFEIAEERIGEGKTTDFGVNLTVNSEFGDLDFRSISGFTRSTVDFSAGVDGFNIPFLILDPRRDQSESFSQEFNLSSSGGRFEWTVGAFGFYEKYKVNFRFPFPNLGIVQQFLAEPEKTWSYAAFGDFSYSLLDDLRIIGGLRLGHDRKTIVNDALTFSFDDPSMLLDSVSFEGEYENTTLAPKIGLQYDFTEDVMGYVVFQQGYKGGGFNFAAVGGDPFLPEKITSYEAGLRSTLLDGSVTANLTGFYYDYEDLQVFKNLTVQALVENAPKSRVKGIELELVGHVTNNTTIQFSGSYLDAEFVRYSEDDVIFPGIELEDLSGNPLNRAPDFSFMLGVDHEIPVNSDVLDSIRLRGELSYTDDISFRPFNRPEDIQEGYALLNAYMILSGRNDAYSLRIYGRNLTDKSYYSQIQGGGLVFGGHRKGEWSPPRTFGMELTTRF